MNDRPVMLDLFCCAGGAARGYQRAGFYVIGVDINPQPRYAGDEFIQADAIDYLGSLCGSDNGQPGRFDAVHASPPCQAHSDLQKQSKIEYPDFIDPVRRLLELWDYMWGIPYVIENVEGAPLIDPIMLCGTMFDELRVLRHRLFESNMKLAAPPHPVKHPLVFTYDKRKAHYGQLDQNTAYVQVTGGGNCTVANKKSAMGIDWMTGTELNEAIPPTYTEHLGSQLMAHLRSCQEADR